MKRSSILFALARCALIVLLTHLSVQGDAGAHRVLVAFLLLEILLSTFLVLLLLAKVEKSDQSATVPLGNNVLFKLETVVPYTAAVYGLYAGLILVSSLLIVDALIVGLLRVIARHVTGPKGSSDVVG